MRSLKLVATTPVVLTTLLAAGCAGPTMLVPDLTSESLEGLANALQSQPTVALRLFDSARIESAAPWALSDASKGFLLQRVHSSATTGVTGICEIEAVKPSSLNDHEVFYAIGRGLISCIDGGNSIDFNFSVAAAKAKNQGESRLTKVPAWQFRAETLYGEIEEVSSPINVNWQLATPLDLYVLENIYESAGKKKALFDKKLIPLGGGIRDNKCDLVTAAPTGADDYGVFWSAGIQLFSCIYPESISFHEHISHADPATAAAEASVAEQEVKSLWHLFLF